MNRNVKTTLITGGIFVAINMILWSVYALIWGWQGGGRGVMGSEMMEGFSWWLFPIFMILFWGLVIWGIVALMWGPSGSRGSDSSTADSALEVLKRKHARGEINKEEYEEKKKT